MYASSRLICQALLDHDCSLKQRDDLGAGLRVLRKLQFFSCFVLSSAVCCVPEALLQAVVLC